MIAPPELSVVMAAGVQRSRAQRTIDAIEAQTAAPSIELVVVDMTPEAGRLRLPGSPRSRQIDVPPTTPWGGVRAAGARAAEAPVVAYIEDHCMPQAGWAEALIDAHREPWAAVGYAFVAGNSSSWRSRATLIAEYGFWAHPARGGRAGILPGNNISYKREPLLALGAGLDDALEVDDTLHRRFAALGLGGAVASRAIVAHHELLGIRPTSVANYHYGRLMASARWRGERWGVARRLLYALAVPLAGPAIRALRLLGGLGGRRPLWTQVATSVPALAAIWGANAVGQSAGCLFGPGDASRRLVGWELTTEREGSAGRREPAESRA